MCLLHVVWEFLRKLSTFSVSHQRPHKSPQEEGGCAEGIVPCASLWEGREEGWSPASPLGLLYPTPLQNHSPTQHHAARNTGHCQELAGPGMEHVRNTVPIVMFPAWEQRPKAARHHPKPMPTTLLPGGSLAHGRWGRRKLCSVLGVPTCLPVPWALHLALVPLRPSNLAPRHHLHHPQNKSRA